MKSITFTTFIALSLMWATACVNAGKNDVTCELYKEAPKSMRTVHIWVQNHPELSAEAALEACKYWASEGIQCILASVPSPGFIKINVDTQPCKTEKDGSNMLAYSGNYGLMMVNLDCMHKWGGTPIDPDMYRTAIAHEFGHQFGIWCHIANAHGTALMNTTMHKRLPGITELDHEAYAFRDQNEVYQTTDDPHRDCIRHAHF